MSDIPIYDEHEWYTEKYKIKGNDSRYSFASSKYSLLIDEIDDYLNDPTFLPKKEVKNLENIINELENKKCSVLFLETKDAKDFVKIGHINGDTNKPLYYIDGSAISNYEQKDIIIPILYRPDINSLISPLWYDKYEEYSEDFSFKKKFS